MKINLGGVCKGKDWRNEFIEKINRQDIEFYNPLKKNWKWTENEKQEKSERIKTCDYLVYFITPEIEGFSSIASAVDYSNKFPEKLLFCAVESYNDKCFTSHKWESMKVVRDLIRDNGGLVFDQLDEMVMYINNNIC